MMTSKIERGDRAPLFTLHDQNDQEIRLYSQATGGPIALIFVRSPDLGSAEADLDAVSVRAAALTGAGARLFVISNHAFNTDQIAILDDKTGATAEEYGATAPITGFLLDANLRVIERIEAGAEQIVAEMAQQLETMPAAAPQAPVLLIPRVFDRSYCRTLIDFFETNGGEEGNTARVIDGVTIRQPNSTAKRRRDLSITDESMIATLGGLMGRRVLRELHRAFQVRMSFVEEFKLGRYDADDAGFFRAHRDNTTPGTRHRKFAMTLNLNSEEYEGGELRFPEFGNALYKPATGEAIVFSCTLMHEVMPMLSGRRYTLLSFFHDDEGEEIRANFLRGARQKI